MIRSIWLDIWLVYCAVAILSCWCGPLQVAGLDFGYDGSMGPSHWGEQYNSCDGKYQSPININILEVVDKSFAPLVMEGFDKEAVSAELINNGHTVLANLKFAETPTVQGGPLEGMGIFKYSQLHFHWGDNDTLGSEDRINNISFPAELHMVFFNEKYDSVNEALTYDGGLVVLAFFFSLQSFGNPNYEDLTELLHSVRDPNNRASFPKTPKLNDLITPYLMDYFTYTGSLTTPPCSEAVTWIDFEEPILISADQIERFRNLYTHDGLPLKHNFRPIQPLNNRTVYKALHTASLDYQLDDHEVKEWGNDKGKALKRESINSSASEVVAKNALNMILVMLLIIRLFILNSDVISNHVHTSLSS